MTKWQKDYYNLVTKYIDWDASHMQLSDLTELKFDMVLDNLKLPEDIKEFIWNDLSEEADGWEDTKLMVYIICSDISTEVRNEKIRKIMNAEY